MGDWPQSQETNRVTISTGHPESLGIEVANCGLNFSSTLAWPTTNGAIFVPFVLYSPMMVVKMFVSVGTASGNVDVGIYDTGQNRLVSMGSTAMAGSSAIQIFDIADTQLNDGVYYMAVAVDNGTGTLSAQNPAIAITSSMGILSQSSAFPLPNPAVFAAASAAYVPLVGLTARATV